MADYEFF